MNNGPPCFGKGSVADNPPGIVASSATRYVGIKKMGAIGETGHTNRAVCVGSGHGVRKGTTSGSTQACVNIDRAGGMPRTCRKAKLL